MLCCCVAVSAMAERLANHFACYRPASDLFFQLLEMDKVEDAKFMLAVSMSLCVYVSKARNKRANTFMYHWFELSVIQRRL